jgi:hypothetical protein
MPEALRENYTQVVVLCDDRQHWIFAYRFLTQNGVHIRRIRPKFAPSGQGSGEQYVREQYQIEVAEQRKRAARINCALIVIQDCDVRTLEDRRTTLEHSAARGPNDRIALLFPKRNIETWIHFLTDDQAVNESDSYPKLRGRESDCHDAADRLAAKNEYRLSADVPPSLRAACPEIRRIFPEKRCVEGDK